MSGILGRLNLLLILFIASATLGTPSFAAVGPQALSIGGELYNADGTPVNQATVAFTVSIYDATATCVLYSEIHEGQDLSRTPGHFNLIIGAGTSKVNNVDGGANFNANVFNNAGVTPVANCGQPNITLGAGDRRQIRVSYDLGAGLVALTPDVPLVSSAYAMVADSLQGKTANDFIQVASDGSSALTQANTEFAFSATNWPKLQALLNGTSTQYLTTSPSVPVDLNGQRLTHLADPTAAQDAATKNYVDASLAGKPVDVTTVGPMAGNGSVLRWDATDNKWVAGIIDTSATGTAGGDLQGTYPNPTLKNDAVTAAKINSTGGGANRLLITDATTGATVGYGVCALNEVYAWTASGWACTAIATLAPVRTVAGKTGDVLLNAADVAGLGTAALLDYGTSANQVPRLDSGARLPAVDGSLLTNVNAALLQTRVIAEIAPTPGQVLGWNGSAWLPVTGNAGSLTRIDSGAGLVGGPITTAGTLAVDVGTAANKILQLNASAQLPAVDGSLLYDVKLGTRTVASTAPSANQVIGWNQTTTQWEPMSVATGSVTNVAAGAGLTGGPITSTGTLAVDVGTAANKILQLNASAQLPAVDGSLLSSVNAVKLQTRAVAATAPTAGQVLGWNATAAQWEPLAVSSGTVTSVVATTGLLGGTITSTGTVSVDVGSAAFKIVQENANAQIAQTLGSVTAPTYSFVGNTATGAFSPAVNQYAIATGGTTALTILANGNVGVGETAPGMPIAIARDLTASAGLHHLGGFYRAGGNYSQIIAGYLSDGTNDTAGYLYSNQNLALVTGNGAGATEKFRVTAAGAVGIGTTAPGAGLDVATTGTIASALIVPRDSTANRPTGAVNGMLRYNNTLSAMEGFINGAWSALSTGTSAGTVTNVGGGVGLLGGPITSIGTLNVDVGSAAFKVVQENANAQIAQTLGSVALPAYSFVGDANTGIYSPAADQVALAVNGTAGLNLNSSGNVGIGSTAPINPLVVYRDLNVGVGMQRLATFYRQNGNGSGVTVGYLADGLTDLAGVVSAVGLSRDLAFASTNGVGTSLEKMRVTSSGSVGVGTTTPQAALDVFATGTVASAIIVPRDTTTNRPTAAVNGMLRYNTSTSAMEGFVNGTWSAFSTGTSAGTVTNVGGGVGLTGGPITATGTLNVDVGSAAFKIVQENANAQIAQTLGTVAQPAYSFAGNLKTGLFSAAANTLSFATNGTAAVTIAPSGFVGIGTALPQAAIDVYGAGSSSSFIHVTQQGTANAIVGASAYGTGTSILQLTQARGTYPSPTATQALDVLSLVQAQGFGASAAVGGTSIYSLAESAFTNASAPSALTFGTTPSGGVNTVERIRIASAGTVGIGTTTPMAALDVFATGTAASAILVPRDTTANRPSSPVNGMLRYNNSISAMEAYQNGAWATLTAPGSAPAGANNQVQYNSSGSFAADAGFAYVPGTRTLFVGNASPGKISAYAYSGSVGGTVEALFNTSPTSGQILGYHSFADLNGTRAHVGGVATETHSSTVGGTALTFSTTANGGVVTAEKMRVDANGNVGIGTASPQAGLDVAASGGASAILVPRDTTANRPSGAVNGMLRYNTTTSAMETYVNGGWQTLASTASVSSSYLPLVGGMMTGAIQQANGTAAAPGLAFANDATTGFFSASAGALSLASTGTTRLTVAANGFIGIGTDTPTNPLTLSTTNPTPLVLVQRNGVANANIQYSNQNYTYYAGVAPSGSFGFGIVPNIDTSPTFTITQAGNVGIGNNSPGIGLDVNATGLASAIRIPRDTSANRPVPGGAGMLRYNTTLAAIETFSGSSWNAIPQLTGSQLSLGNGTVGAPTYTFADATTGMYSGGTGNLNLATAGTARLSLLPNGNVGVGSTNPAFKVDVVGDVNTSTRYLIAGTAICTSAGCTSTSDIRLKENVRPLEGSLDKVLRLDGVSWEWIDKAQYGDGPQVGLIAQELEKIYPEVVRTDANTGVKSVGYYGLIGPLVESIKTLYAKITGHDERLVALEDENAALKTQVERSRRDLEDLKARMLRLEQR